MKVWMWMAAVVLAAAGVVAPAVPAGAAPAVSVHCGVPAVWTRTDAKAAGVKVSLWVAPMPEQGLEICAKAWDTRHRRGPIRMSIYVDGVEDQEVYRASGGNVVRRGAGSGLTVRSVRVRVQTSFVMFLVWSSGVDRG